MIFFARMIVFLFLFVVPVLCQYKVDGIVAVIGENIIMHSDVLQQAQIISMERGIDPSKNPRLFENIYDDVLKNIIDQNVVLSLAEKDTNLIVSDDEVSRALEQRVDEMVARAGSKELFEGAVGMSLRQVKAEYWPEIKNMMLIERYKFSKIQNIDVSRVEVYNFYDSLDATIPEVPEQYDFSVVEIPFVSGTSSEQIVYNFLDSLRSLIKSKGLSFDSLANKYSQDPGSASSGGRLGYTARGSLVGSYEEAVYSLDPGEISLPTRSEFGYHIIRLIKRVGEKVSSQHILRKISVSMDDKNETYNKAMFIYNYSKNDPFVFDSIATEYTSVYNNFSGVFSNYSNTQIPDFILSHIKITDEYILSTPIETGDGFVLVYLYKHRKSYFPNPDNDWNRIYQYALTEKQNRVFVDYIDRLKKNVYINIFYK